VQKRPKSTTCKKREHKTEIFHNGAKEAKEHNMQKERNLFTTAQHAKREKSFHNSTTCKKREIFSQQHNMQKERNLFTTEQKRGNLGSQEQRA
jgi:hypothetical protein